MAKAKTGGTMTIHNKGRRTWQLPEDGGEFGAGETKAVPTKWGEKMMKLYPREFTGVTGSTANSGDLKKLRAQNKKLEAEKAELSEKVTALETENAELKKAVEDEDPVNDPTDGNDGKDG